MRIGRQMNAKDKMQGRGIGIRVIQVSIVGLWYHLRCRLTVLDMEQVTVFGSLDSWHGWTSRQVDINARQDPDALKSAGQKGITS
jgi:hypothetical protein